MHAPGHCLELYERFMFKYISKDCLSKTQQESVYNWAPEN